MLFINHFKYSQTDISNYIFYYVLVVSGGGSEFQSCLVELLDQVLKYVVIIEYVF